MGRDFCHAFTNPPVFPIWHDASRESAHISPAVGHWRRLYITTAIHDEREDLLYIDGKLALKQRGKYSAIGGIGAVETIGAGYNGTFFKGKIGEILIYDHALSKKEREAVEYYLKLKYGID
jgi:hypothetical protein